MTSGELALVLSGGGARGAYQIGFLRHLARRYPALRIPIVTGVSAGSVNAVYLANHTGAFCDKVEALTRLWCGLSLERVFRVDAPSLGGHALAWLAQLTVLGGRADTRSMRGLVDTEPLAALLGREFGEDPNGELPGIRRNLESGALEAVAVTATRYATGQTITFCQGRSVTDWDRPLRRSEPAALRVEHVMASAALPLFFPAVRVGASWYGDGGIRLHSPLAPAAHLGASHIVAVSTSPTAAEQTAGSGLSDPYPPPAQILGILYNAIFLDLLDQDAVHLKRINRLLESHREPGASGLRQVELLVLRPSRSLSSLAAQYEPQLPGLFRFLLRRLGTQQARGQDVTSLLMFQGDFAARAIELGESDADARSAEIEQLLEAALG